MDIITEIVSFTIQDGIPSDQFVMIVDKLECEFHSKQPGFIDTELLYDNKNNSWIMIQHWGSMGESHEASKKMFTDNVAKVFRETLVAKSVKINKYPQLRFWS